MKIVTMLARDFFSISYLVQEHILGIVEVWVKSRLHRLAIDSRYVPEDIYDCDPDWNG